MTTREWTFHDPDARALAGRLEFRLAADDALEHLAADPHPADRRRRATIQLQFVTGFGTAAARDQRVTLRLRDTREVVTVGRFTVAP